ncbi:MAG: YtxH domain-containing protein [Chloroflexota bacterium]|nr:MAG: YtxH domain-containing protein [Chloroflexota bacterium]
MAEECVQIKTGNFSSLVKGLLIGGLVGAGVALLSAPRTGMETREMIRDKSMEIKDRAMETAEEARRRAEDVTRKGVDRASELKERGQVLVSDQKNRLDSIVEGIREGARTYTELNSSEEMRPEGDRTEIPSTGEENRRELDDQGMSV